MREMERDMWLKEQHKNETSLNHMNSIIKHKQGDEDFVKIGKLDMGEKSLSPAGFREGRVIYKDITQKHIIPDQGVNKVSGGDQAKLNARKQKEKEFEMANKNLTDNRITISKTKKQADLDIGSKALDHHIQHYKKIEDDRKKFLVKISKKNEIIQ